MRPQPINELAMWLPMNRSGLLVKSFNDGYPYTSSGIIMRSTFANPVNRYAKNYVKHGKKFSLCLITNDNDSIAVEAWLDGQAGKIKLADIETKFKMLGVKYEQN